MRCAILLGIIGLFLFTTTVHAQETPCSSCEDCQTKINSAATGDTITLANDITSSGTCIVWSKSGVIFDCENHTITGGMINMLAGNNEIKNFTIDGARLQVQSDGNTISGCNVSNSDYGIYIRGAPDSMVNNNTISNCVANDNDYGIIIEHGANSEISNCIANNNEVGILVGGPNNTVSNCTVDGNSDTGIKIPRYAVLIPFFPENVDDNLISGCSASSNNYGIFIGGDNNQLNSSMACSNTVSDIAVDTYAVSPSGDENTCDTTDGWNDTGTIGCTYSCGGTTTTSTSTSTTSTSTTSTLNPTNVTWDIKDDTTWGLGGSPYYIMNDVEVRDNSTLTIEAGVQVQFTDSYRLDVEGNLVAEGNSLNMVEFVSSGGGELYFEYTSNNGNNTLEYCRFNNTRLEVYESSVNISDSIFSGKDMEIRGGDFTVYISNNTFIDCSGNAIIRAISANSYIYVTQNEFKNCTPELKGREATESYVIFSNNTVQGSASGALIKGWTQATYNTLHNNTYGVDINDAYGEVSLSHNLIYNNSIGIYVEDMVDGGVVTYNTITRNVIGIFVNEYLGEYSNNNLHDNSGYGVVAVDIEHVFPS